MKASKKRIAMIGGGINSMIGSTHIVAMEWFGQAHLVAGCFSRNDELNQKSAATYGVDKARTYSTADELLKKESPETLDAVVITTPNETHVPLALEAAKRGFHVMCEKPLANVISAKQCSELREAFRGPSVLGLAHHNTGWPAIRKAREIVDSGILGDIRLVRSSYIQGWLAGPEEFNGNPQAEWRMNPKMSGPTCTMGDIGTHAINLMNYVSGLSSKVRHAQLKRSLPKRVLDDIAITMLDFGETHIPGIMTASQSSAGYENSLELHIDGSLGGLSWIRDEAEQLTLRKNGSTEIIASLCPDLTPEASKRITELFANQSAEVKNLGAFANLYLSFFESIEKGKGCFKNVVGLEEGLRLYDAIYDSVKLSETQ